MPLQCGHHRLVGAQQRVGTEPGHHRGHGDIQHRADGQRSEDADRQVALRVARFLRRHRRGLEADVGEKHHRRAAQNAAPAVLVVALRFGDEGVPVGRVDIAPAHHDHQRDQADFQYHHGRVGEARFADADVAEPGQQQHQHHRRQVEQRTRGDQLMVGGECQRRVGQRRRQAQVHAEGVADMVEQAQEITRPAHGYRRGGYAVFQHQVPADEPRHQLAQGGVRVGVGAAGYRDQGGEFGVAQRGERAADGCQQERQDHRRPRVIGGCLARDHEDAATDHRADAQRRQSDRPQRAAQGGAVGIVGIAEIGLAGEQLFEHGHLSSGADGCCAACATRRV